MQEMISMMNNVKDEVVIEWCFFFFFWFWNVVGNVYVVFECGAGGQYGGPTEDVRGDGGG